MYKKCITTQHLQFQPIKTGPSFNLTDTLANIISWVGSIMRPRSQLTKTRNDR